MRRLQAAERARRAAIEELIRLGAVRSHVLVGDLGERITCTTASSSLAEAYVGANGKLSWTQKLARAPAVAHLDAAQLARGDPHSAGLKRSPSGPGQDP
jgi:hypothetical protein